MTKILVADDNSNIQRMVIQALAHLNTEVVAVNNGQAAVRKVTEISPDLVLADIFMPVRNGYEVCEFVKKNPATAHVPVILLAGAFDPLDEREAQRVGADGILKKPFVPPDPLVNMVQTLLSRLATMRMESMPAAKRSGGAAASFGAPAPAAVETAVEEEAEVLSPAEKAKQNRVAFGESDAPLAFSSLLETPAEAVESPASHADGNGQPINESDRTHRLDSANFWRDEAAPLPETAQAQPSVPQEHSPSIQEQPPAAIAHTEELPIAKKISTFEDDPNKTLQPINPMDLVRDEPEVASPTIVNEEPIVLDPSKYASLTVDAGPVAELAKNPLEWMASIPAAQKDATAESSPSACDQEPAEEQSEQQAEMQSEHQAQLAEYDGTTAETTVAEASVHEASIQQAPVEETADVAPHVAQAVESSEVAALPESGHAEAKEEEAESAVVHREIWPAMDSFADPGVPIPSMEEPAEKHSFASFVAPAEPEVPASEPAESNPEPFASPDAVFLNHDFSAVAHENNSAQEHEAPVHSFATHEPPMTAHMETEHESPAEFEESGHSPVALQAETPVHEASSAAPENLALPGEPDPALVEAVVQRVLDKMRPQVVDIITREFLRPVVQALVHREIEKH